MKWSGVMLDFTKVTLFRKAMGQPVAAPLSLEELRLSRRLIAEESEELQDALAELEADLMDCAPLTASRIAHVIKEACDVLFVTLGLLTAFKVFRNFVPAWNRVCSSNLSKLVEEDGKLVPLKDSGGKVLKGPNYKPPKLEDLVA